MGDSIKKPLQLFLVTGTFHGSWIWATTEGEARRIFHEHYNGESITHVGKGDDSGL